MQPQGVCGCHRELEYDARRAYMGSYRAISAKMNANLNFKVIKILCLYCYSNTCNIYSEKEKDKERGRGLIPCSPRLPAGSAVAL